MQRHGLLRGAGDIDDGAAAAPPQVRDDGLRASMYPRSLPLIASTKASSGKSTNAPKADAPALLTRMSMPPNRSAACATNP
jgi:hypothetical protein